MIIASIPCMVGSVLWSRKIGKNRKECLNYVGFLLGRDQTVFQGLTPEEHINYLKGVLLPHNQSHSYTERFLDQIQDQYGEKIPQLSKAIDETKKRMAAN